MLLDAESHDSSRSTSQCPRQFQMTWFGINCQPTENRFFTILTRLIFVLQSTWGQRSSLQEANVTICHLVSYVLFLHFFPLLSLLSSVHFLLENMRILQRICHNPLRWVPCSKPPGSGARGSRRSNMSEEISGGSRLLPSAAQRDTAKEAGQVSYQPWSGR